MRNAPFHAFTVSVRGGDNVDTLFPGAACELRTPGGEAALGTEGHLQIKTSDAPEVRGPLFPLFEDSPGPELPRAPWGVAYGALSPTQEKEPATHSGAHELPESGRGSLWGNSFSPKANEEPSLSLPTPPPPSFQLAQQPLGGEQSAGQHQPAEAPQLPADEIWGW